MTQNRLPLALATLTLPVLLVAGCTSSDSGSGSTPASTKPSSTTSGGSHGSGAASGTSTSKTARVYQGKVPDAKSIGNLTSARKSVTLSDCAAAPGGWKASGTARNSGTANKAYTITIFFTTDKATVQSYAKTKVEVAAGSSTKWSATGKFPAAKGTLCVLRGVA